jgi:hypothetical protein
VESPGILAATTPISLALRTEAIDPGPKIDASNCESFANADPAAVATYFVRVRTSVSKDYPWTPPYGDDWVAKLELGGGALVHTYHPKLAAPGIAVVAFCQPKSAGDEVEVKVSVKEDDLVFDDKYAAFDQKFARGSTLGFSEQSTKAIGGRIGDRPIASELEIE